MEAGDSQRLRRSGSRRKSPRRGKNGLNYWLKDKPKGDVKLEFLDSAGKLVHEYSSKPEPHPATPEGEEGEDEGPRTAPAARVTAQQGMNRFIWNQRYADATTFPGIIMWAGGVQGPRVSPGHYQVRITLDGKSQTQEASKSRRIPG